MQDIANKLNISKNAVSQALTGKPGVSEATRKLIFQVAEELGYHYPSKKRTRLNGYKNIGLIASDYAFSQKSFFGEIYLSIEKEILKRGMNLVIQSIDEAAKEQLLLPSFIENNQMDGLLILSHINTEYIQKVISTEIPTVLIDHHHPAIRADCILTNNRFGAYTSVQHLIGLNHKEIGFVGNISFSPSYQERLEGYNMALSDHGINANEDFILKNAREEEDFLYNWLEQIPGQPTAWFCVNDGLGFLMKTCLQKMGKKIPQDVSICSFDNGQLSRMAQITSMDIDLQYYGKKAVEQLCWRMENRNEPFIEILLPSELIKRESTSVLQKRTYEENKNGLEKEIYGLD
ncbi:LacI family DNA-binding transcriptional regulator [Paenactinomyces guangxiensis]|uniref:LacI family DNA-binding transcriptional regulator n=1 Tax=Paenactinomyces guangxiensis TaxID=1490290 RepID=A0A7W1WPI1_9BACL|nr:LacI family DNA-binding transcriptional regulator [Paenactinomyces guangxiensis]MBA4493526.1 LacI family DNA-binding transcriptional regulator [Paenactinomyces guangxiensis]MBH8590617.1 LacI family DNA-binding transcriptional regulator [Paenactinomyces guangxiensis]